MSEFAQIFFPGIIRAALTQFSKEELAEYLDVSIPCLNRWKKGNNLPVTNFRTMYAQKLAEKIFIKLSSEFND